MNIRQRITLLIALTFAALSFIGGFAVFQSRGSASEVKTVTEGVVPSAMKSVELMTQLKDVQIATLAMVAAPDKDSVVKTREELAARKAELQKALADQYKQADSDAQRGLVKQAEESLINYFGSIDDTANFKLAGQKELAEATLAATVDQYLREQGSVIETLQVEKRRSKDAAIANVNDNLSDTTTMLTVVTLIAVIGLSAIGVFLYRQIIHPIGEMESKMTEIASSQDFSHRLPVNRMDEIGRSVMAFNVMVEKIQESSELIKQKTADIHAMLHYIPQGILTLETGNRIHPEYSDYLKTILETDDIAGRDLMEVVFSGTSFGADIRSQIETALSACIGEDVMNFEFNSHLLVTEIEKTMPDGRIKILDLSWSPITDENDITVRLMLCVRDVTELKALAQAADAQKRELAIIGEILAVRHEKFHEFITSAGQFIDENEKLIREADAVRRHDTIALLFRNMHTIKGNARTYGLLQLTNVVHEAEQSYDDLRNNPDMPWDGERLLQELERTRQAVDEYARINDIKLGRKGAGRRGNVEKFLMVPKDQIQHAMALLERADVSSPADLVQAVQQARHSLAVIGTERVQEMLAGVLDSMPSLAQELGKEVPQCTIDDNDILLRTQLADMFKNVCMHLYRNAMDHGIETATQRQAKDKPAAGQICLALQLDQDALRIKLRDDGRGLAVGHIGAKALEKGLIEDVGTLSAQEIAQLIFEPGFSTAEQITEISGRGVGMDAVKGFIEAEGGQIQLLLAQQAVEPGFYPFETVITLPAKFAVRAQG